MSGKWMKYVSVLAASALGIAGAAAIAAASPASAAPIVLGTATVKELASGQVTGVNCRRRYYGATTSAAFTTLAMPIPIGAIITPLRTAGILSPPPVHSLTLTSASSMGGMASGKLELHRAAANNGI
jgi:hypothetical protein